MPSLAGYTVSIMVDGAALPEYGGQLDVEGETQRRSVFVPSESGKRFQIRVRGRSGGAGTHVTFQVFVDARSSGVTAIEHGDEGNIPGVVSSNGEWRPWYFGRAQVVSDEDGAWARDLYEKQKRDGVPGGKIRVEVRNFIKTGSFLPDGSGWVHEDIPIHEKAKEASKLGLFTHTTGKFVGEPLAERRESVFAGTYCEDHPIAEFTFHYRSKDLLDAKGITAAVPVKREGDRIPPLKPKRYRELNVNGTKLIDLEHELRDGED
ncbi:hypothetical protein DFJ74DRAFT_771079 [Hyaloraphidium curvatum]|nr:hypothetical protein DFJ74DRAFT_771079 [Hyaloraphidium curvatum]